MKLKLDRIKLEKQVILCGTTQAKIAQDLGMSKQAISAVFCGHSRHPPTVRRIAENLGLKARDVWIEVERQTA